MMIPYGRHSIDQQDIDHVVEVLKSDWLTCGPIVEKFENELANAVHAKYAVSCANGTAALHLAMLALGIKSKDTVLVPAITFLASANAARYVGANVVFVDVDPETGLMTAETLETTIRSNQNKNLKAVVNVHFAGQCEDLKSIYTIAKKYNLLIIEDAAHAIGSIYLDYNQKYYIGSNAFSDITTFSFHPVKTIAMGEGGAITTNDAVIAEKLKLYRSHGMIRDQRQWQETQSENIGPWYYEMHDAGYNYRISDINCALGLSQLKKLQLFKTERAKLHQIYDESLATHSHIKPLKKQVTADPAWHLYIILIDFAQKKLTRAAFMQYLKQQRIGTQVHYIPLYKQPYYQKQYTNIVLPGAENYYAKCLSLPLYVGLTDKDIYYIVDKLK